MTDEFQPEPEPRAELLDPYLHPYRWYLPTVWGRPEVVRAAAIGTASAVGGFGVTLASGSPVWVVLGLIVLLLQYARIAHAGARAAAFVWRTARQWDAPSELGAVRARRPHAGEVDAEHAHEEFAVTVEDTGHLFVWRFTPLRVVAPPTPGEVLVPGRPRWSAAVVEERPLDPDASRAAEQLVEAQDRAAELEEQARRDARQGAVDAARRLELARETSSTAAALRHLTGQPPAGRDRGP